MFFESSNLRYMTRRPIQCGKEQTSWHCILPHSFSLYLLFSRSLFDLFSPAIHKVWLYKFLCLIHVYIKHNEGKIMGKRCVTRPFSNAKIDNSNLNALWRKKLFLAILLDIILKLSSFFFVIFNVYILPIYFAFPLYFFSPYHHSHSLFAFFVLYYLRFFFWYFYWIFHPNHFRLLSLSLFSWAF